MSKPFSVRHGYKKQRVEIQKESMDTALRNRLWNCLVRTYLDDLRVDDRNLGFSEVRSINDKFLMRLFHLHLKGLIDTIPDYHPDAYETIRDYYFKAPWDEVYDFVEFIIDQHPDARKVEPFVNCCNAVLQEEMSYYRLVGGIVTPITSDEETEEIEKALTCPVSPVAEHLEKALASLSDKKAPDYPNSIKDSVCAIESLCKVIANDGSKTLPDSLKGVTSRVGLHPALRQSLDSLYGFRNVVAGIAHGGTATVIVEQEEARFFLIASSAWVNYLTVKAMRAKLKI